MSVQVTFGAGLKRPEGHRVEVGGVEDLAKALAGAPAELEAWWAPHLWTGDARDSEAWESACCIGLDLDRDGHAPLDPDAAIQLEAAARAGQFSGSIFHRTPAGARIVFVLEQPCTDSELFAAAARGAARAASEDLRELSLAAGLSIDPKPHCDLARLYFTPNSIAKGVHRSAEVVVMRRAAYRVEELSDLAEKPRAAELAPRPPPRVNVTDKVKRAAAYVGKMGGAIAGCRGDDHSFRVAAMLLNDFDLSEDEARAVLWDWNTTCQPPWPDRDLERFIRSARKNGKHRAGEKLVDRPRTAPTPRQAPNGARPVQDKPPEPIPPPELAEEAGKAIPLVRACDVVEKPVEWVVEPFLARGELTDLSGDPGVGKGGITVSWAARVTRQIPDATVIFFATEDPLGRVRARLRAEEADLERVLFLDITQPNASPILPGDAGEVEEIVRRYNAALLILDPALEFMQADLDSHKQQDVARFMGPLLGIAQRTGAAFLTVRHNNKNAGASALHRASGSIGFTGKVRLALTAAKNEQTGERALAVTKNNLGPDKHTVSYNVVTKGDAPIIAWGDVLTLSADELVNQEPGKKRGPAPEKLEAACDLLRSILAGGPMKVDDVLRCARSEGISRSRVYLAKDALAVEKVTLDLRPAWRLPPRETRDAQ